MAPKAEVTLGSRQVDAPLDSLPPIPQRPLSQCPRDPDVGKYVRGYRRGLALRKQDPCPQCLQARAPGHIQTPPGGDIQGWGCDVSITPSPNPGLNGGRGSPQLP